MMRILRFSKNKEKGQVLVIVAVAFIALLAFVGLTVDVGQTFIQYAHLRRGVDAASLAAAAQFREFRTIDEMTASANEFLRLNGIPDANSVVQVCDPLATPLDTELCSAPYRRKLVRVRASTRVTFSFLPVIGIYDATLTARAVGEAASLDVVLVLDRSASMASDSHVPDPKVMTCNPHNCHPFEEVRAAAKAFVDNLYFPYDRVAVVTLDQQITLAQNLTTDHDVAIAALDALTVMPEPGNPPCNYAPGQDWVSGVWSPIGILDPSGCTTTNLGGGLRGAGSALTDPTYMRSDSLWVVVLITDGAANHALTLPGYPNGYCPATSWLQDDCNTNQPENIAYDSDGDGFNDSFLHNYFRDFCPICRDAEVNGTTTRHVLATDPDHYDADDYARDQADLLVTLSNRDMIFFTIGLGPQVEHTNLGRPDAGLQLLQYIADVAHGQYYASASPADLGHIFEDIAQRIFTRITR